MPINPATKQAAAAAFARPAMLPAGPAARRGMTSRRTMQCVSRKDLCVRVYLVTDRRKTPSLTIGEIVEAAVRGDGGRHRATVVQLRDKEGLMEDSIRLGRELREICVRYDTAFIVNDDAELAKRLGADGVHLGQTDGSVAGARAVLGEDAIVGVSAGCVEEARRAVEEGADYVGVGAVFDTKTKADAGRAIGTEGLQAVVEEVAGRIGVVAIGGVNVGNAAECRNVGADGIAVVSAVMSAEEPGVVAAELSRIMS